MRSGELWFFFFLFGVIIFNWPFLTIFRNALPTALFVLWGLFIAAAFLLSSGKERDRSR